MTGPEGRQLRSHSILRLLYAVVTYAAVVQEQVVAGEDPQASDRMPPISSYVVDTDAAALLAAWTNATKSCP